MASRPALASASTKTARRFASPRPMARTSEMTTAEATEKKSLPRLKQRYREEIRDTLQKEFGYSNVMQIPGVVKVIVNMGVGDAARDAKLINGAVQDLALITGPGRES